MIKNKSNIGDLLKNLISFSYEKDDRMVNVQLITEANVNMRYYDEKCITINYLQYEDAVSELYKDRKYINKVLFQ